MDLWIRSQDKERLIKADKLYVEFNGDVDPMLKPYRIVADKFIGLGRYKSKERALEVLDEIQNIIIKLSALSITGISNENIAKEYVKIFQEENITSLKAVYEMPKE